MNDIDKAFKKWFINEYPNDRKLLDRKKVPSWILTKKHGFTAGSKQARIKAFEKIKKISKKEWEDYNYLDYNDPSEKQSEIYEKIFEYIDPELEKLRSE